jgi:hypothetical protein
MEEVVAIERARLPKDAGRFTAIFVPGSRARVIDKSDPARPTTSARSRTRLTQHK